MKKINIEDLNKLNNQYVWYGCYGSNINTDRLMIYINGDTNEIFGHKNGCKDKSKPVEVKPYIFKYPIYFASHSNRWNGGVAFLDYEHTGKSYGKIYKLKIDQFIDIYKQEYSYKKYDTILYVDDYDNLPVFTFTASHKLKDIEKPSKSYKDIIKKGLLETYNYLSDKDIENYFKETIDN